MPPAYLDEAEKAEKAELSYNPILDDFSLADRFHWDEEKIGRQREEWLLGIECAMIADGMVKATAHDEVRQKRAKDAEKKQSHDHEDASTKGKSLAKVRSEYAALGMMPEDATDEEVAAMIGRAD